MQGERPYFRNAQVQGCEIGSNSSEEGQPRGEELARVEYLERMYCLDVDRRCYGFYSILLLGEYVEGQFLRPRFWNDTE